LKTYDEYVFMVRGSPPCPQAGDWPAEVETTGYWDLAGEPAPLPEDLRAFIADGSAPVFVGFGSMVGSDPARTTGAAFAAGRPQLVCPFVADQPFWGRLVQRIEVGRRRCGRNGWAPQPSQPRSGR
jgi:hypothetical protein